MIGKTKNWSETTLGKVAQYLNGKAFKSNEWENDGLPIIRIQNLTNSEKRFNYTSQVHEQKYSISNGELLFSWSATLSVHIWNRGDAWLNQHIFKVVPNGSIDKLFLYYLLNNTIDRIMDQTHGMGMVHITKVKFENTKILLPPLNEQKRIAEKLDKAFTFIDSLNERLEGIPDMLKQFRRSVLREFIKIDTISLSHIDYINFLNRIKDNRLSLCRSKKEEVKYKEEFESLIDGLKEGEILEVRAELICDFITKGTTPKKELMNAKEGIPYLKVYNIVNNNIEFEYKPQFVNKETHDKFLNRSKVYPGDVLMNIVGPPLCKVAIVPNTYKEWNINQAIAIFRPIDGISTDYIYHVLTEGSQITSIDMDRRGTAGQSNLSLAQCRDLKIKLIPTADQKALIAKSNELFALADKIEKRFETIQKQVKDLPQSLLAKAFRGELVPQDPNDEPAEKLLERIKVEMEALKEAKRRKEERKNEDKITRDQEI